MFLDFLLLNIDTRYLDISIYILNIPVKNNEIAFSKKLNQY